MGIIKIKKGVGGFDLTNSLFNFAGIISWAFRLEVPLIVSVSIYISVDKVLVLFYWKRNTVLN